MERHRLFSRQDGVPHGLREQIEGGFKAAATDASTIKALGGLLQKHGVFEQYEDRFFALVKGAKRRKA
jgi:hypothetical protein